MRTFVTAPRSDAAAPGVVFYSDIFQLTEPALRRGGRLAGHGFLVAVPEIYHRIEPAGTVLEFDDEGKARGQGDADALSTAAFDADVAAARAWLGDRSGGPLGAAGHCTGGHLAFRAALHPEVRATACWYATGLHDGRLGADDTGSLLRAGEIEGELLAIWGTRDPHTPEAARETIRAGLAPLGSRLTWREYGAEQAFGRDGGGRFAPGATEAAFAETIALFRRALAR